MKDCFSLKTKIKGSPKQSMPGWMYISLAQVG
jgi:hypothetical protein